MTDEEGLAHISFEGANPIDICIEKPGYAPTILTDIEVDELEVILRRGRPFSLAFENIPEGEEASVSIQLVSGRSRWSFASRVSARAPELELPDLVTHDVGEATCSAQVSCEQGNFYGSRKIERLPLRQIVRLDRVVPPVHVQWEPSSPGELSVAIYVRGRNDRIVVRGIETVASEKGRVSFVPRWEGTLMAMGYSRQLGLFRAQGPWFSPPNEASDVTIQLQPAPDPLTQTVLTLRSLEGGPAVGYRLLLQAELPSEWTFGGLPRAVQIEETTDKNGEARLGKLPPTFLSGIAISPMGAILEIEKRPVAGMMEIWTANR